MFLRPANRTPRPPALVLGLLASLVVVALLGASSAAAKTASEKLEAVEGKISEAQEREGVLTTAIAAMGRRIDALEGRVAGLRERESAVEAELAAKQAELDEAEAQLRRALDRLEQLRGQLRRALLALRARLVAMYVEGSPDITEIVLSAEDYDELVSSAYYLEALRESDTQLSERVKGLRDEAKRLVVIRSEAKQTIEAARDEIAAREQRLETTRTELQSREAELVAARGERRASLRSVRGEIDQHEEIAADLRAEIAAQLAASTGVPTLPAGSLPSPSAAGFIWPVDGVLTSTFGYRWGRMHEGIDIGAAEGTPIRAAAAGTVVLVQSEASSGGYGNFTCVDHGSGLSTCYAHQSSIATSPGAQVGQDEVIGYVGNTGHSFGAHLHFEVRYNGAPVDPLGYL
ncbi:MAG: peptidoglycan DD-metalloendopeptidase family protein [Solirubrobacterales bacterium]